MNRINLDSLHSELWYRELWGKPVSLAFGWALELKSQKHFGALWFLEKVIHEKIRRKGKKVKFCLSFSCHLFGSQVLFPAALTGHSLETFPRVCSNLVPGLLMSEKSWSMSNRCGFASQCLALLFIFTLCCCCCCGVFSIEIQSMEIPHGTRTAWKCASQRLCDAHVACPLSDAQGTYSNHLLKAIFDFLISQPDFAEFSNMKGCNVHQAKVFDWTYSDNEMV